MPLSRISAILMQVSASLLVGFGLLLSQSLWAAPDVFREMTADVLNPSYRYAIQKGSAQERAMVFAIASVAGYFLPQEIAHLPTGSHIWPDYFLRADGKNDPIVKETMQRIMSTAALRPIPGPDQIFDKLVVVTHQRAELQESTIQVLQSPVYAQTPNVIIASPQFSFQFPFGNWRPTYIQNGDDEMLGYPFVAKEVVFMGGYSALCLAITIHNIVMEAERLAMPEITLRFLSKYIYEIENYAPTIQQLFSKKKILEKDFFENIEQNIMSFESPAKSRVQGSFRASPYDLQGRYIVGDSSMRVHVIIEK